MKNDSDLLNELINALTILPGVGIKSAQRMAFNILEKNRDKAKNLSDLLRLATEQIRNCNQCRNLTEQSICNICSDEKRDQNQLIQQITNSNIKEIIVATSPTVEGDATSFYIRDQITKEEVKVTRIAYGVPMGGELEYVDNTTLGRAIQGRREIKE